MRVKALTYSRYAQWSCSPACTELEVIVMDWAAKLLGLLPRFLQLLGRRRWLHPDDRVGLGARRRRRRALTLSAQQPRHQDGRSRGIYDDADTLARCEGCAHSRSASKDARGPRAEDRFAPPGRVPAERAERR